MKIKKYLTLLGIFTFASCFLTGCHSFKPRDPSTSNLPWAKPASWEGNGPAMKF